MTSRRSATRHLLLATALFACAALAGCSTAAGDPPDSDLTGRERTGAGAAVDQPQAHGLDVVGRHPNGTVVHLRGVEYLSTSLTVDLEVVNGYRETIQLNACPNASGQSGTLLEDDRGNRYRVSPPEDDDELRVEPGGSIEGRLVFLGRLDHDATELTFAVNAACGSEGDGTTNPQLRLEFPVQRGRAPSSRLDASGSQSSDLHREVFDIVSRLEQVEVARSQEGTVVTVPEHVLFSFDDDTVLPGAADVLSTIAEGITAAGDGPVWIRGHTDSIGDPSYNQVLSERRADTVRTALVDDHGVDPQRLSAQGQGATEPVADNTLANGSDNPEGRRRNRRVEVVIAG